MSATFSECRTYRYTLTRELGSGEGTCVFIGLNPSTADETQDDPTIRRCIRYAREWGYARLVMLNLYAFRATDPKQMFKALFPIGPDNMRVIYEEAAKADLVVCAWGAHAEPVHEQHVMSLLPTSHVLGLTAGGNPRHPLYMRADVQPVRFLWRKQMRLLQGGE
jgi:hypothetical protein